MGSLCTPAQTTSTYTPNPVAQQQSQAILSRANQVASTPYQAYGGQRVADLNSTQQAGIANVNNAYGTASPYFNQATQYATQGAAPVNNLSASDINQYYSPYQNDVINSTMANINETNSQQQNQLRGSIASRGALGGDRQAVLQSELARQQGLAANQTLAGLQNQGFQSAAGIAQGQQANQQTNANRQAQAAYTFGNLGNNVQNAATQGGFAQLAAGQVGQAHDQANLDAQYQAYLQQQAFPYQQTSWLSGIANPTAGSLGGTQTSTPAAPSALSQIAGIGLTAASFAKDGGRITSYAGGGAVSPFDASGIFGDVGGYVPKAQQLATPQQHNFGPAQPMQNPTAMPHGTGSLRSLFGGSAGDFGGSPETNPNLMPIGGSMGAAGNFGGSPESNFNLSPFSAGGLVHTIHAIRHGIRSRYADGGSVDDGSLNPRNWLGWQTGSPDTGDQQGGTFPPMQSPPIAPSRIYDRDEMSPFDVAAQGQPSAPSGPSPLSNGPQGAPQPSPFGGSDGGGEAPPAPADGGAPQRGGLFNMSHEQRHGLLAAGLGILGGSSPYAGVNIGQGGLKGVEAMANYRKEQRDAELKKEAQALRQQHADVEARRLAQQAEQHAKDFGLKESAQTELRRMHDQQLAGGKIPPGFRPTPEGGMEAIPGGPHDPEVIAAQTKAKQPGSRIDPDTLSDMAGQYLAGDKSVFQNLGRGAQGSENILALRQEVARQAREAGLKPDQIATKMADFAGRTAAMRALGTRGVNVEYAANTANKAIDLAEETLGKVPRTQFVPFNQLRQLVDTKTSSPEQAAFYTATNTLVNEYARVAAGGSNQATEGMRQHAREMLNTAMGPEAYKATLNMMRREIKSAKNAYTETRKEFLADHSEEKPDMPAAATPKVGEEKQFKQGVGVWNGTAWVPKKAVP